jgi:hypothetical protein
MIGYGCVFVTHVIGQFLLYGHPPAFPIVLGNELGIFLVPFLVAFVGYLWVFERSPIFRSRLRWRFAKFLGFSVVSTIVSLYAGILVAINPTFADIGPRL